MSGAGKQFTDYWSLGYTRLVPIVPPDVQISENSSLARGVGTDKDPRGKAVGIKGRDGFWRGFDWVSCEADLTDIERWQAMGAGIGVKTGQGLIAIDADTTSLEFARIIKEAVAAHVGQTPVRVGRYPKALYLCRISEPCKYSRVEFGERNDKGRLTERVEILSDGRQFVAEGVHPATRKPYTWPRPLVAHEELPVITPEQLDALFRTLREALPAASEVIREGSSTEVNQEALRGDLALVQAAVEATPNTSQFFPSRESYRDFGYAIKAALPDHPEDAFAIFKEWCDRWDDGVNESDVVASDWKRMKPPFRRGASWLYDVAEQASDGAFSAAARWFEPIVEADNPFTLTVPEAKDARKLYDLLSIGDLFTLPDPKFVIDRHIPERSLGFLYGEPGTGKSFIALDWALHMAFGRSDWHGDKIEGVKGSVLYLAGEAASGFKTRVSAWMSRHEVADIDQAKFALLPHAVNFMKPEDVLVLADTLRAKLDGQVSLIVIDTVSRAMPGADENLQKEMTLFVRACDALKEAFGCVVIGVHHAGKRGDMRGSTVLLGAGDFVFKLDRSKGKSVGHLFCEKQKEAPDGWSEAYRFDVVELPDGHSSLVPSRAFTSTGPEVKASADLTKRVLTAMDDAWKEGDPWGKTYRAKERMAARIMTREFGVSASMADELLDLWEATGLIKLEVADKKNKKKGFKVDWSAHTENTPQSDVFA